MMNAKIFINIYDIMREQMKMNGGNCWRITLIVMWSSLLAGTVVLTVLGLAFDRFSVDGEFLVGLFLPSIIEIVCFSLIIYGVSKYNYCICVFGAVWSGIHMLGPIIAFIIVYWKIAIIIAPLIWTICLFSFSVVLSKKLSDVINS